MHDSIDWIYTGTQQILLWNSSGKLTSYEQVSANCALVDYRLLFRPVLSMVFFAYFVVLPPAKKYATPLFKKYAH